MKNSLLIADDNPDVASALRYLLQVEGYHVDCAASPEEVIALVKKRNYAVVLLDLNYTNDTTSGQEGFDLIEKLSLLELPGSVIAMTAWGSIETAVRAMQLSAKDFIEKPWENERLLSVVATQVKLFEAEQRTQKLKEENRLLRREIGSNQSQIVWRSLSMQALMEKLEQVAASNANILLTGENGTGKSMLVNCIHSLSSRKDKPLVKVNMGAIPENLFESEMFGHVKGAFTDARDNRIGRFELADEGTLFLDEIGITPFAQQAKLLRVLEDHCFEKVGSTVTQKTDCRLVSATNTDLGAAVETGHFRRDLMYRINTVVIDIPPLRKRAEDIPVLAEHFLLEYRRKYQKERLGITGGALSALQTYSWPGNIRELAHTIERASILANDYIGPEHLGLEVGSRDTHVQLSSDSNELTLEEIEKLAITERVNSLGGDNQRAAKSLGVSKSAFYRKLEKHGLN
ncbi:MAG TPA: sigma-54-dependent Fis family transcriptional regulator [Pseudohongiella sp.]|nr:sigma-54-dependent Fis family transcriptional regulator [Pseudohongiella sp.]